MSNSAHYVIVVGMDFSELATRALDHALEIAAVKPAAEVHVVYVEPDVWVGSASRTLFRNVGSEDASVTQLQHLTTARVDALLARMGHTQIRRVVAHVRRGSPAENIAQMAADMDADLVVVGSHGHRGVQSLLLGSVAERVSRLCRCPVVLVRPKEHATAGRVPDIQPPCADCLAIRAKTSGGTFWCSRHSEHHARAHRYSYTTDGIYSPDTLAYEATPERLGR